MIEIWIISFLTDKFMYPCVSFVYLSLLSLSVLLFKIFNFRFHVFLTGLFPHAFSRLSLFGTTLVRDRFDSRVYMQNWGWSGGAKVLCILHHRGVQLILAYSWARPAILVVGKGRGGMFLFLLFLHFHSCSSFFPVPLFHLLYSLFYLFSPFLWETTQNDPQGLTCR